jgi:hypothetical protein
MFTNGLLRKVFTPEKPKPLFINNKLLQKLLLKKKLNKIKNSRQQAMYQVSHQTRQQAIRHAIQQAMQQSTPQTSCQSMNHSTMQKQVTVYNSTTDLPKLFNIQKNINGNYFQIIGKKLDNNKYIVRIINK